MGLKRFVFGLLLCFLLAGGTAFAQEAQDITKQCKIKCSESKYIQKYIKDRKYDTEWASRKEAEPWIHVTAPEGALCSGVYICFSAKEPIPWKVQVPQGDGWATIARGAGKYLHEYAALPDVSVFRITTDTGDAAQLRVAELYVLGEGDLPGWVQIWEPTPQKADILLLIAHPDDEYVFFGGLLPDYAVERGCSVVVALMTAYDFQRVAELLNGLWRCGVRTYPSIGRFTDRFSKSAKDAYRICGGKEAVQRYVIALFRKYRPEVVVTHDLKGEYGHGMHMACADASLACAAFAADPAQDTESAESYGVWQIRKLYLHLYPDRPIHMDWEKPLSAFGGQTGREAANEALKCHTSQQGTSFTAVYPAGHKYSASDFGLAFSTVGEDRLKNDFLENIP